MRHVTLSAFLLLTAGLFAQPGSLDPTFGDNGKVIVPHLNVGQDDQAVTAVVLPDDKILVAGRSANDDHYNTVLLRFHPDGSPDATFGTNGVVHHDLGPADEFVRSAAIDAQGRLVVGGHLFSDDLDNSDMFVARFLPDGSLDASFAGTGLIIRDLHYTPDAEEAYEVLLQPDGKIVLCGFTGTDPQFTEIIVERYLENGGLDPTFGGDGSVLVAIVNATGEQLRSAALGTDGGIYFCGFAYAFGENKQSLLLGHVDATGSSPSTFGNSNGYSLVSISGSDLIGRAVAAMPDGGFAVGGVRRTTGATQARIIYTFDATGNVITDAFEDNTIGGDAWNCLLLQNNGSIIAGGNVADGPDSRNWSVERKHSDLGVDGSFITEDYDEDGGEETCFDLDFTSDSSIIAVGSTQVNDRNHIVLLKYLNDILSNLNEVPSRSSISAFPNPAMDRATVMIDPATKGPLDLALFDAQGRAVRRWSYATTSASTFELDLMGLLPGMYALQLKHGTSTSSLKLAKQ